MNIYILHYTEYICFQKGGPQVLSICEKHIWPAFKLILSAGTPIQKLIDRGGETHLFLNHQALNILKNDKRLEAYRLFLKYISYVDLGNHWADQGWKCFGHYYKPQDGKGFIPWISAVTEGINYFNRALSSWKKENRQESMFYLGAAAHIVQDMCVPHHAMGIPFNGHRKFEIWAINNKNCFKLDKGGTYRNINGIKDLIDSNAIIAQQYYNDVAAYNNRYVNAGKEMLYLAQRSTAHLFEHFSTIVTKDK